jgi:hypothetical protein
MTLYTRTTPEFDPVHSAGTFVCAEDLGDTYGFCELGYDRGDYERPPLVWEVKPMVDRFISTEELIRVCREAHIQIFEDYDQYEEAVLNGYVGSEPGDSAFLCMEEEELNTLLERPEIRAAAEAAGWHAAQDYVVVTNMQPLLTVFWEPGTFTLEGPLPIISDDPDIPQSVTLADAQGLKP